MHTWNTHGRNTQLDLLDKRAQAEERVVSAGLGGVEKGHEGGGEVAQRDESRRAEWMVNTKRKRVDGLHQEAENALVDRTCRAVTAILVPPAGPHCMELVQALEVEKDLQGSRGADTLDTAVVVLEEAGEHQQFHIAAVACCTASCSGRASEVHAVHRPLAVLAQKELASLEDVVPVDNRAHHAAIRAALEVVDDVGDAGVDHKVRVFGRGDDVVHRFRDLLSGVIKEREHQKKKIKTKHKPSNVRAERQPQREG